MGIKSEELRIRYLWRQISYEIKQDLANVWKEETKKELEELKIEIKRIESEVIKILKALPSLKKDYREYHKNTRHLVRLLRHVKANPRWVLKVRGDLLFRYCHLFDTSILFAE